MNRTAKTNTTNTYKKYRKGSLLSVVVLCLCFVFVLVGIGSSAWNIHLRQDSSRDNWDSIFADNPNDQLLKYINSGSNDTITIDSVNYPVFVYDKNSHSPSIQENLVDTANGEAHSRPLPVDWFDEKYTLIANPTKNASDETLSASDSWEYLANEQELTSAPVSAGIYRYTVKVNDNAGKYKDKLGTASMIYVIRPRSATIWITSQFSVYGDEHNTDSVMSEYQNSSLTRALDVTAEENSGFIDDDFTNLEHTKLFFEMKSDVAEAGENNNRLTSLEKTSQAGSYAIFADDNSDNYLISYKYGKVVEGSGEIVDATENEVNYTIEKRDIKLEFNTSVSISKIYAENVDADSFYKQLVIKDENGNVVFKFENNAFVNSIWNTENMSAIDAIKSVILLSSDVTEKSNAGNYDVTPTLNSENYNVLSGLDTRGVVSVIPLTAEIQWDSIVSFNYDGNPHAPTASVTNLQFDDVCTVTVSGAKTEVGSDYTATITGLSNGNYALPENGLTKSFEIKPIILNVSFDTTTFEYDKTAKLPTPTLSGVITADIGRVTLDVTLPNGNTAVNAGDYTATLALSGEKSNNYTITINTVDFTITQRTVTITWSDDVLTYNGLAQLPKLTLGNIVNGDVVNAKVSGSQVNAGENYTAKVEGLEGESAENYKLPENNLEKGFSITKAELTVKADSKTITYGDDVPEYTATITGLIGEDVISVSFTCNYTKGNNADVYSIVPSLPVALGNYNVNFVNGALTVEKRTVTLTWSNTTLTYNGSLQKPTVVCGNVYGEDSVSVNTIDGGATNVGNYTATAKSLTNANYKLPDDSSIAFEITPLEAVIEWFGDTEFVYDGNPHAPTARVTNLKGSDVCNVIVSDAKTEVGNYTALVLSLSNANYKLPQGDLTIQYSITAASLTVTFDTTTFEYDKTSKLPAPTLSGVITADVGKVTLDVTLPNGSTAVNAGDYTETLALSGEKAKNYTITINTVDFTITQRTVIITWSDDTFTYDGNSHCPTVTLDNIISGDDVQATVSGAQINVGNYTAVVENLSNANYTLPNNVEKDFVIAQVELTATANSFAISENSAIPEFTYEISGFVNGETASVLKGTFEISCECSDTSIFASYPITLTYTSNENENYSVTCVNGTLTIGSVLIPEQGINSFDYDGTEKTYTPQGFMADKMTISGNVQTNAGTYTATVSLSQELLDLGLKWSDDTIEPKEFIWIINKKVIEQPIDENLSFEYTASEQSFTLPVGYDPSWVEITGTLSATNIGSYTVTITPTANYKWATDTTCTRKWSIVKKQIATPTVASELIYNGSAQSPLPDDFDVVALKALGVTFSNDSKIDTGTYILTISLGSNCVWKDGAYVGKNTAMKWTWKITPKRLTISNDYFEIDNPSDFYTFPYVDEYISLNIGVQGICGEDDVHIRTGLLTNGSGIDYKITVNTSGVPTYNVVLDAQYAKMGISANNALYNFIGSTYRGSNLILSGTKYKNYTIDSNLSFILKYKSVLVGSTYYTIEDALAQSGDVVVPAKEYWTSITKDYSSTSNFFSKVSTNPDNPFVIDDYTSRKKVYVEQTWLARYDNFAKSFTDSISSISANYTTFLEQAGIAFTNNKNLFKGSDGSLANNTVLFKISNGTYSLVHNPSGSTYDFNTIIARLVGLNSASAFNTKAKAIVGEYTTNSANASADGYSIERLRYNGAIYTKSGLFIIPLRFNSNKVSGVYVYCYMIVDQSGNMYVFLSNYENAYKISNMNNVMNLSSSAFGTISVVGRTSLYNNNALVQTMTTFTGLNLEGANFSNYSDNFAYSHASKIILKSTADGTNGLSNTTINNSVHSSLIIPGEIKNAEGNVTFPGVTLNLTGDVVVPGVVTGTGAVSDRAVIVNNGTINQNAGTVYSYGYIKGEGTINLASGTKAVDVFDVYDWLGGRNSLGILNNAKNVFPISAYSLHNISCHAIINTGAQYAARFYASTSMTDFDQELVIVDKSGALFNLTSGYVDKYARPAEKWLETSNEYKYLYTITGSNQTKGQRDIVDIYGDCTDGTISVTKAGYTIEANTNNAMPIGYMDINICSGTLNLSNVSYKFLPGSSLTVGENGNLVVGSGVKTRFYSLDESIVDEAVVYTNNGTSVQYPAAFVTATGGNVVDRKDSYLLVKGTATYNTGSSVGGLIVAGKEGAILELNGSSTVTIKILATLSYKSTSLGSGATQKDSSSEAVGNILGIPDSHIVTGSYIGFTMNDTFVWGASKADIVFDKNFSVSGESSVMKTLSSKPMPYTLVVSDYPTEKPSRQFYNLELDSEGRIQWYMDSDCTKPIYPNDSVYSGTVLYAHWIPIDYTVKYGYVYDNGISSSDINKDVPSETFIINFDSGSIIGNLIDISLINNVTGYTFDGWFTTDTCANRVSDASTLLNSATINPDDNSVTIYGKWIVYRPSFTVKFETGSGLETGDQLPSDVDYTQETVYIAEQGTWTPNKDFSSYRTDKQSKYYFGGWYLDSACTQKFTSFAGQSIEEKSTITLYSKWIKKNELKVFWLAENDLEDGALMTMYYVSGDKFTVPDPSKYNIPGLNIIDTDYIYIEFDKNGVDYSKGQVVTLSNEQIGIIYLLNQYEVSLELTNTTINSLVFNGRYKLPSDTTVTKGEKTFSNITAGAKPWFYVYSGEITNITFTYGETKGQKFNVGSTAYTSGSNTKIAVTSDIKIIGYSEKDSGGSCLAAGTMFLMPDGTQKKVEDLTTDDYILVFNHETGKYESAKIMFIDCDGWDYWEVVELSFANGTSVKVIYEHGFFDLTENTYVYIDKYNAENYIGHEFATTTWNGFEYVTGRTTLTEVKVYVEFTGCYSPTTVYHLNVVVEGLMSMPGGIQGMFNFFDYDPTTLAYDSEAMTKDIETYGLLPYEFFKDYFSYGVYCMFPAQYVGISLGKGLMTEEYLMYLIERYIDGFNLEDEVEHQSDQSSNGNDAPSSASNPLANVVVPPSSNNSSSSGGSNDDGSNDDDS